MSTGILAKLNDARAECSAKAAQAAERHDLKAESQANDAALSVAMSMAKVPAETMTDLLIKARVARQYVERTDGEPPDDPIDRLWLSIADDLERLAGGGA